VTSSIANHRGAPWEQVLEPLAGSLRTVFLDEREKPVEDDHHENGDPKLRHAGENRQAPGNPEHGSEEVHELREETPPQRQCLRPWQQIPPVRVPPYSDLFVTQAR
jgi:hypothetical protein